MQDRSVTDRFLFLAGISLLSGAAAVALSEVTGPKNIQPQIDSPEQSGVSPNPSLENETLFPTTVLEDNQYRASLSMSAPSLIEEATLPAAKVDILNDSLDSLSYNRDTLDSILKNLTEKYTNLTPDELHKEHEKLLGKMEYAIKNYGFGSQETAFLYGLNSAFQELYSSVNYTSTYSKDQVIDKMNRENFARPLFPEEESARQAFIVSKGSSELFEKFKVFLPIYAAKMSGRALSDWMDPAEYEATNRLYQMAIASK